MVIFKLLAPILLLLITALQIVLDYIWHDKRTRLHRRTRRGLLFILVATGIVTLMIVVDDTISAYRLQNQLTGLQDTLDSERLEASQREEAARRERATLLSRLNELHFDSVPNDSFKPLDPDTHRIALDSIRAFLDEERHREVTISVSCHSGNRNRQFLAQGFTQLLRDAGASVEGPQFGFAFSNAILPSIQIVSP